VEGRCAIKREAALELDGPSLTLFRKTFACSAELAAILATPARRRDYQPKSTLIAAGASVDTMALILFGTARLLLYTRDGQTVRLHDLRPGDLFGGFGSEPAAANDSEVISTSSLGAAVYRLIDFVRLAENHGCVGLALSRMLLKSLQWTTERLLERNMLSANGRVYAELLRLSAAGEDGRSIRPAPIVTQLAESVQTSRETASRAIAALERRGIITRTSTALTIVARRQLEDMVV
jgi:CRP/FNR family cyclic AMP-dependent transcriptional regulator